MNRPVKKLKKDDTKPILSGNFMISIHDKNDDNDEIPIASPDATCNEVPVNSNDFKEDLTSTSSAKSLKNLIHYIKSNYSPNINTPKWKNFNGLKLQPQDKIRLNNVIWRTWFQQYGIKDSRRKKPLICQFSIVDPNLKVDNKDWKQIESVTNEYKKWREFSRKQIAKALTNEKNRSILSNSYSSFSKQTFSNRCRSPSPGLFQDLEIYNFTSDTLFTSYIDDPKDPILGTNPDLFQPELMKFFPNFDFLDFDFDPIPDFDTHSGNNSWNTNFAGTTSNMKLNTATASTTTATASASSSINVNNNNTNSLVNPNLVTNTNNVNSIPSNNTTNQTPRMDYTDLTNFDTLATVAAQSPHLNQEVQYTKHSNQLSKTNNTYVSNSIPHTTYHTQATTNGSNSIQQHRGVHPSTSLNTNTNANTNTRLPITATATTGSAANASGGTGSNTIRNLLTMQSSFKQTNTTNQVNMFTELPTTPLTLNNNNNTYNNHDRINTPNDNVISTTTTTTTNTTSSQHTRHTNTKKSPRNTSLMNSLSNITLNSPQPIVQPPPPPPPLPLPVAQSTTNYADLIKLTLPNNTSTTLRLPMDLSHSHSHLMQSPQNHMDTNILLNGSNNNKDLSTASSTYLTVNDLLQQITPQLQQQNDVKKSNERKQAANTKLKAAQTSRGKNKSVQQSPTQSQTTSTLPHQSHTPHHHHQQQQALNLNNIEYRLNGLSAQSNNMTNAAAVSAAAAAAAASYLQANNVNNYVHTASSSSLLLSDSNSPISNASSNSGYNVNNNQNSNNNNNVMNTDIKPFDMKTSRTPQYKASKISRSNSLSNISTLNDSLANCSSAELKRRTNIQYGFERIQQIIPSLNETKNGKASKAQMLQKTAEYIRELQAVRDQNAAQLQSYKHEMDMLSNQISDLQSELPESGVSMPGTLNKQEKFRQKFASYIQQRTIENWKFYLFSLILKPLFETYTTSINTSSNENMQNSITDWQNKHCTLSQLRPIVSGALRQLSRSTSILSEPNKLPQECYTAALSKLN